MSGLDEEEAAAILAASTSSSATPPKPMDAPRSDGAGLSKALANADKPLEHDAREQQMQDAAKALAKQMPPVFKSHSDGMRRRLAADLVTLNERRRDLQADIALKQAELEDVELAIEIGEAGRAKGNAQSG